MILSLCPTREADGWEMDGQANEADLKFLFCFWLVFLENF